MGTAVWARLSLETLTVIRSRPTVRTAVWARMTDQARAAIRSRPSMRTAVEARMPVETHEFADSSVFRRGGSGPL